MISGCPKRTVVKMEPSNKGSEQSEIREAPRTGGEETKREDAKKEFEKHRGLPCTDSAKKVDPREGEW